MKNNIITTFYIIRHGESEANVKPIVQGQGMGIGNTPLTEKGREQAKELSETLSDIHFDAIFSSDAIRAKQTADIIAKPRDMNVHTEQALRERSFGKYEGMPFSEFLEKYTNFDLLTDEEKFEYKIDENEESFAEAYKRFSHALFQIAENNPGETVLIVTHGGMIRGLLIKNGYGDFDQVGGIENCGYVKVTSDGSDFQIVEVHGLKPWKEKRQDMNYVQPINV